MGDVSGCSTRPSVIFPRGIIKIASVKLPREGLQMYEAKVNHRRYKHQVKALENRLANLARQKARVEAEISAAAVKSDLIIQKRRILQADQEIKARHAADLEVKLQAKRDKARRDREFHRTSMSKAISDLRSHNAAIVESERKLSKERRQRIDVIVKAERSKRKAKCLQMSATHSNFRTDERLNQGESTGKLRRDYTNRILSEQLVVQDLQAQLSQLVCCEQALVEQLSSTLAMKAKECSHLQIMEANRNLMSRSQLARVMEEGKLE
jgi:hypothetical protein